jgi:hypothetical protein
MNLRSLLFWVVTKHMSVVYKHLGHPISPIFLECITNRMSQSVSNQLSFITVKTTCIWHWKPKIWHRCTVLVLVTFIDHIFFWPYKVITFFLYVLVFQFKRGYASWEMLIGTLRTKSSVFIFCKFIESTVWVLYFGGQGFGADTPVALRYHQLYL